MALSPSEQKRIEKIEKLIKEKEEERAKIIKKASSDFSKISLKLGLWKLDKKTIESELKSIAEKYKTA